MLETGASMRLLLAAVGKAIEEPVPTGAGTLEPDGTGSPSDGDTPSTLVEFLTS